MRLDIELEGSGQRWRFGPGTIRVGRDAQCTVAISDPGVSRDHAIIIVEDSGIRVQDLHSGNGTWVNGVRVMVAEISNGDRIRLGEDGPELVMTFETGFGQGRRASDQVTAQVSAVPPPPAVPAGVPAASPTMGRAAAPASPQRASFTEPVPRVPRGQHATIPSAAPTPAPAWSAPAAEPPLGRDEPAMALPDETMLRLEAQVTTLRRLAVFSFILTVILIGLLFWLADQVDGTRNAVFALQMQARGAVGQLMPQLDQRLHTLEGRMDGMDAKMKAEEDQFMARMNVQLPQIMDRYVNQKLSHLGVASVPHP